MDAAALDQLKDRMRIAWMGGDFSRIAQYSEPVAEEFVAGLKLSPGMRLLDLACGSGNVAVPAARLGAIVTGIDIAPNLLEKARSRASQEGLTITFEEADAEALPFSDAAFDVVTSMFGVMFAPRPDRIATEMARVCKPGGVIHMANWTPQSFTGRMSILTASYVPPSGVSAPVLWGDAIIARERLMPLCSDIETIRRQFNTEYPLVPKEVVQLFRESHGPTNAAFCRLDAGAQAAYAADLEALWSEANLSTSGGTTIRNEFLEITAIRA